MLIGADFDNTIVCYDRLFHRLARERSLIPAGLAADKQAVRDYLRQQGIEDAWTELQGEAYGRRIHEATPFAGVKDFFLACRRWGIPVCVISHKTRRPVLGPDVDLHHAARVWLEDHGFLDGRGIGLPAECIFFEETKERKLQRILRQRCTHFIDDLPQFLSLPGFPASVERILFDPWNRCAETAPCFRVSSWGEVGTRLLGEAPW